MIGQSITLVLGVVACGQPAGNASLANARDSAGVRIVRVDTTGTHPPEWTSSVAFTTEKIDSVGLGTPGGTAYPARAQFVGRGSLAIGLGSGLYAVDAAGQFLRRWARKGEGPGELSTLGSLVTSEVGSLVAIDATTGRVTEFATDGKLIGSIPRLAIGRGDFGVMPLTRLRDGRTITTRPLWRYAMGELGTTRDTARLFVFDSTGALIDSAGQWHGTERVDGFIAPVARATYSAGRGATTVVAESDSLDLWVYREGVLVLRLVGPPGLPVSAQDRAAWDSAIVIDMGENGAAVRDKEASVKSPPHAPGIAGLQVDDHDNIWVGRYAVAGSTTRRWDIYSLRGALIATIELPALPYALMPTMHPELLDVAADRLALLRENADGEYYIEVRRISRTTR